MCIVACLYIPLSGFAESFNNSGFSSWNCGLHHLQIKANTIAHQLHIHIAKTKQNKKRSKSSSAAATKVLINEEKTKRNML